MNLLNNYQRKKGKITTNEKLNHDLWSGKTLKGPTVQITEGTSKEFSQKLSELQKRKLPMFLYLKTENGANQDASWELETTDKNFPLRTDYITQSFGEYPKEERESHLSQILEEHPLQKYSLSETACKGILKRAYKREKQLPELLEKTLMKQAHIHSKSEIASIVEENETGTQNDEVDSLQTQDVQKVLDSGVVTKGNGDAYITSDKHTTLSSGGGQAGQGYPCVLTESSDKKVYSISSNDSNAIKSPNPHSGCYEADTSRTLDTNGGNPACNQGGMVVIEKATNVFGKDKVPTLVSSISSSVGNTQDGFNIVTTKKVVQDADMYNQSLTGDKTMSITGVATDPHHIPCVAAEGVDVYNGNFTNGVSPTLTTNCDVQVIQGMDSYNLNTTGDITKTSQAEKSDNKHIPCVIQEKTCYTVDQGGGKSQAIVMKDKSPTLTTTHYGEPAVCYENGSENKVGNVLSASKSSHFTSVNEDVAQTLVSTDYKDPQIVAYGLGRGALSTGYNSKFSMPIEKDLQPTLIAQGPGGVCVETNKGQYLGNSNNSDKVNSLCASDYKGVSNQYISDGKAIIQKEVKDEFSHSNNAD